MRRLFLFAFLSLFLFSCAKESFVVDDCSLKRSVDIVLDQNGSLSNYKESLQLSAHFSQDDLSYSFQIKSPDGDLVWEGEIEKDSAELGITPGATFPIGDYHAIFYGDNGTESTVEISLSKIDFVFPYINKKRELSSRRSVTLVEYSKEGEEIKRGENIASGYLLDLETAKVQILYVDRYLNSIEITQEL